MPVYRMSPHCVNAVWGGDKLIKEYNIGYDGERLAEAWVLACHEEGISSLASGEYTGMKLNEYVDMRGRWVLGTNYEHYDKFPVLVKLIDARSPLSIQVHPGNTFALSHEGQVGKTEMWYVLDAEEDSYIYYGLKEETTKEQIRKAATNGTLLDLLKKVPAKKGNVFYIPAGTLHAIGPGLLVAEVQQNSSITYRVYDYDRTDANGKKRELHLDKAIEVVRTSPNSQEYDFGKHLVSCKFFIVDLVNGEQEDFCDERSFVSLLALRGNGSIYYKDESGVWRELHFKKGDSFFVPAGAGRLRYRGEDILLLRTQI